MLVAKILPVPSYIQCLSNVFKEGCKAVPKRLYTAPPFWFFTVTSFFL